MQNTEYTKEYYHGTIDAALNAKNAFLEFANKLVALPVVTTFHIGEAIITMEEELNELLGKIISDAEYEAGIREELPHSRFMTAYINSRKKAVEPAVMFEQELKSNRIVTNPQTKPEIFND